MLFLENRLSVRVTSFCCRPCNFFLVDCKCCIILHSPVTSIKLYLTMAVEKKKKRVNVTIVRKIRLFFDVDKDDAEARKECYKKIYSWNDVAYKAANMVATHQFLLQNVPKIIYLTEGAKMRLVPEEVKNRKGVVTGSNEDGLLTTSLTNTTYQVLSNAFKGTIPTAILTSINRSVTETFSSETIDYFKGQRSLRSYKRGMPIPFPAEKMVGVKQREDGNYSFTLFDLPFRTFFGRDWKSNNRFYLDQCFGNVFGYKLCQSSLKIEDGKIFLLATISFPKRTPELLEDKVCEASLSIDVPIIAVVGNKKYNIGSKEEFLYRRQAIQETLRRKQREARYNVGKNGSGTGSRRKILKPIRQFENMEHGYIILKLHAYSRTLINYCLEQKCATLLLKDQKEKEEKAKEDEFLLRNWSYHNLVAFIKYKADMEGITVVVE